MLTSDYYCFIVTSLGLVVNMSNGESNLGIYNAAEHSLRVLARIIARRYLADHHISHPEHAESLCSGDNQVGNEEGRIEDVS